MAERWQPTGRRYQPPVAGHRAPEEGNVGTVLEVDPAAKGAHGVLVRFDEPVHIGWVPGWAR